MTDDIVTRLRDKHGQFRMVVGVNNTVVIETIYGEAADEIERLQALTEHLASQLRLQMKANDKAWEAYKEVVGDG